MAVTDTKAHADLGEFEVKTRMTREVIEKHRQRCGSHFDTKARFRGPNEWCHWDRVRTFCVATGDMNPLYNKEEYAQKSPYGTVVAPPSFVMSRWCGLIIQGMPGVHIMMGGNEYEFLLPIVEGDKMECDSVFARLKEKKSKFSDLFLVEEWDSFYTNQFGDKLVNQMSYSLRHERSEIGEGLENTTKAAKAVFPHPWTHQELEAIQDEQLDKKIQGSTPLFWEDVNLGDSVPDLLRGPARIMDHVAHYGAFNMVWGGPAGVDFFTRAHRGYAFWHPDTHAHEHIVTIHWDKTVAKACQYPYPYDFGHIRHSWQMTAMTDWIGDHGWLKISKAKYHRMLYLSDVIRIKSQITKKYVDENGEHCIDLVHHAMNQREEDIMPGESTVVLPSKVNNRWPVQERVAKRHKNQ